LIQVPGRRDGLIL